MELNIEHATADKLYMRIEKLLEWHRYDEAIKETEEWIRINPGDPDGFAMLAKIFLYKDDYPKALQLCQETFKMDPENVLAWNVKVGAYYSMQNWKLFSAAVEDALILFPFEDHYYFLRGNMFNKQGDFNKAKEDFERCLEVNPENALYLANYSYTLAITDELQRSKEIQQKALEFEPDSSHVFLYLAWAADHRRDYKEAIEFLKNAIRLDPEDTQIRQEYLSILQKQYLFYRVLLYPGMLLGRLKPWQFWIIWPLTWIIFKKLVILFLIIYFVSHWLTKLLVHIKVFGWKFSFKKARS